MLSSVEARQLFELQSKLILITWNELDDRSIIYQQKKSTKSKIKPEEVIESNTHFTWLSQSIAAHYTKDLVTFQQTKTFGLGNDPTRKMGRPLQARGQALPELARADPQQPVG